MSKRDYYDVLGVGQRRRRKDALKSAFRRLAKDSITRTRNPNDAEAEATASRR